MPIDHNRRTNAFAAALLLASGLAAAVSPQALAQAAGSSTGLGKDVAPAGAIAQAQNLIDSGRLIDARAALDRAIRSDQTSESDRQKAMGLLKTVDARIKSADPVDISLQKAEMSMQTGDLLSADRWAKAVAGKPGITAADKARAQAVVDAAAERREELRPTVPGLVEQAGKDFKAGNYGAAKSSILAVLRSGIDVGAEASHTLENYQLRIVEIEKERGRNFEVASESGLAAFGQPGTVRRPGKPAEPGDPAQGAPAPQPEPTEPAPSEPAPAAPAAPAPADEPPVEPAPAPAPAPEPAAVTPPPAPAPVTTQDDLIRTAMRADAQRVLAEADRAFESARFNEAVDKYEVVVRQYGQYLNADQTAAAQRRLDEARVKLNAGGSPARVVTGMLDIRRQQAIAEFENEMTQANQALAAADAANANSHLASANLRIKQASEIFTAAEMAAFTKRTEELKRQIEERNRQMVIDDQKRIEDEEQKRTTQAELNRINERDRKINESIDRIRALQQERKYREALQVVDQVLFLDPNNPTGLLLKSVLDDIVIYADYNEIQGRKALRHARASLDSEESTVPAEGVMEYPTDWPSKTFQRGELSAFAEPRENRQLLSQLASTRLPADFTDNNLEDVLNFIQQTSNFNMDIDWEALNAISVRKDTKISLKLSPVSVQNLLDRVLAKAGDQISKAGWTVYNGVVTVSSDEQLRKNRSLVIYNIQDLLFDIPDYTEVPEIDLQSVLQQGEGGGNSPFDDAGDQNADEDRPTREERIRQIQDIITSNVDSDGWRDNGGDTGAMQELNGSLIITNTPGNHREIVGLLSKLREIRNMQINVETKFLLVNQSWFEQIGFDLDIVINANNNQVRTARAQDPSLQPGDFFDFTGQNGGDRGLVRQITGFGPVNGQTGPITAAQRRNAAVSNPRGWSPVGVGQNSLGLTNGLATSAVQDDSVTAQVLSAAPALGIAGQFLDDIQVDFLIQATQADRRTVQLTAPRLTFTNGQTANIYVVTQQAFVSDLQPIVGDSAVGFDPQVDVVSEGVTMRIEGVVSADRRYVTMNIEAGVSRVDGFGQESVSAVAGGQLVNSADTQSFIQLPTVTVTRVQTTATVPDEGTVLLGGQRLVTEVEIETGVPVLSKIPIINRFFTNRLESKEEQTLLILLKPTILIQSEQEDKAFPGLLDSVRTGIGGR